MSPPLDRPCTKMTVPFKYTVKPAHMVTSIELSPVFKGHPFFVLS